MKRACKKRRQELNILVSRMVRGELAAFSTLYKMYYNKLFRYGNIILPGNSVVEDVIQDLFVWILKNPQKINKVNDFEIYLFQSLKNNLKEHRRKKNHAESLLYKFSKRESTHLYQDSIEHKLMEDEGREFNKELVKQKLAELPPHQKEIIYLRYFEGLSYDEIADVHSTNNQVIRNYVSRAIKRIRKLGELENLTLALFIFIAF